jgi:integrase
VLANWRLSSLPRYLRPEAVECIAGSCDVSSRIGKRDRAIPFLLARLGLRAGDIVRMRLYDIDLKDAWLHVNGKSRRQSRLPLTQEVGDAIVAYLQESRPRSHTDILFLRSRALPKLTHIQGTVVQGYREYTVVRSSFASVVPAPLQSFVKAS